MNVNLLIENLTNPALLFFVLGILAVYLKSDLEKILKNPYELEFLVDFDIISWLDSKIEKRPFAEIVRKKAIAYSNSKRDL